NSNDPQVFAEMFVSVDKDRFTMFRGQADSSAQIASRPIQLAGLDADRTYEIRLLNPDDVVGVLNKNAANNLKSGEVVQLSGAALMAGALRTPNAYPLTMHVFEGIAL
ncbi:MAG: GH36 C-terminal domain-containing protein, partial [Pseudomonadota bacterium]